MEVKFNNEDVEMTDLSGYSFAGVIECSQFGLTYNEAVVDDALANDNEAKSSCQGDNYDGFDDSTDDDEDLQNISNKIITTSPDKSIENTSQTIDCVIQDGKISRVDDDAENETDVSQKNYDSIDNDNTEYQTDNSVWNVEFVQNKEKSGDIDDTPKFVIKNVESINQEYLKTQKHLKKKVKPFCVPANNETTTIQTHSSRSTDGVDFIVLANVLKSLLPQDWSVTTSENTLRVIRFRHTEKNNTFAECGIYVDSENKVEVMVRGKTLVKKHNFFKNLSKTYDEGRLRIVYILELLERLNKYLICEGVLKLDCSSNNNHLSLYYVDNQDPSSSVIRSIQCSLLMYKGMGKCTNCQILANMDFTKFAGKGQQTAKTYSILSSMLLRINTDCRSLEIAEKEEEPSTQDEVLGIIGLTRTVMNKQDVRRSKREKRSNSVDLSSKSGLQEEIKFLQSNWQDIVSVFLVEPFNEDESFNFRNYCTLVHQVLASWKRLRYFNSTLLKDLSITHVFDRAESVFASMPSRNLKSYGETVFSIILSIRKKLLSLPYFGQLFREYWEKNL